MDTIQSVWPSLTDDQHRLLEDMALALAGVVPRTHPQYLTVTQIAERFGKSTSAVYKAMDEHRLPYTTPHGQVKPRYATEDDVRRWLGWT